jgi:UDP-N-acetylglucosamine--N-acetylmuramyl-(pentapeptide) pyrophosphoryl-undecaprenol N-acetylglucosamine transferase
MNAQDARARVLIAAGGTGGHLFPAEALAVALKKRSIGVELATDERVASYSGTFPADRIHIIPAETIRGRNPLSYAKTAAIVGYGTFKAYLLLASDKPAVVVGFGGYPTIPPVIAATLRGVPTIIHDSNAVIGRANRMLAPRVTAIATTFNGVLDAEPALAAKVTRTGNPVRPAVVAAAATPYPPFGAGATLRLLAFGGSQGARIMADIVPPAIELIDTGRRARLTVVQQARAEDIDRVTTTYARLGVQADVAPFFADLPARIAASHLVVSRAGASTVAELAAIGRPSILVPLPHALDQDQYANAGVLVTAGGAIRLVQAEFTPERLAAEIVSLMDAPERLVAMAAAARGTGILDAAERLADLVLRVAGVVPTKP